MTLLITSSPSGLTQTRITNGDYYRGDRLGPSSGGAGWQEAEQDQRRQAWVKYQQFQESQRLEQELRFQQQHRAIQSLGQGLDNMFQSLFTPDPSEDLDDGDYHNPDLFPAPVLSLPPGYRQPPAVTPTSPSPPTPARPLLRGPLLSFVGSGEGDGSSRSVAVHAPQPLSSFLGGSAASGARFDHGISPELARFVRDEIAGQHAYFETVANQERQDTARWQEHDLTPGAAESAEAALRELRGPAATLAGSIPKKVADRYRPEIKEQVLEGLEDTKLDLLKSIHHPTDPMVRQTEAFSRDLKAAGSASKELRTMVLEGLAEEHRSDTMGAAPLLNSWMEYAETVTGDAIEGWSPGTVKGALRDAGGKVREEWRNFLDENLNFTDPKER
ncbi:MAG: hypothetical protein JNK85_13560 [Verrucomicrobiales bacterium]|nr:hypothetical protein [Verrucomicrobiales bacterium]